MEANNGNTFRPRLSLDAKKSLNIKPVAKVLSPVPTKKPIRKSLPKLPSEKTKLSSDSKDRHEITISSNETNKLETKPQEADSSHAVEEKAN